MSKKNLDPTQLWRDRKRILGLPLSFTVYTLKNNRLYLREGFFKTEENELLLYRVLDVKYESTLGNKIFGVGTLTLFTVDETHKQLVLKNIKHPSKVRDLISTEVEKERAKLKIRGREIYGASDAVPLDVGGDSDLSPDLFDE
ncbi:MAG: PH domain-containing protein [Clostridia bacterium]|nr:PH domain-containing protein [Clostridia bacterium]